MSISRWFIKINKNFGRRLVKRYFIAVNIALSTNVLSAKELGYSHEIILESFKKSELMKDSPIKDLVWANEETLAFIGKECLWLWAIKSNVLNRVKLNDLSDGELGKILHYKDYIYVSSAKKIFQVTLQPLLNVVAFKSEISNFGLTLASAVDEKNIWLIFQNGIFVVDPNEQILKSPFPFIKRLTADLAWFDPVRSVLWTVEQKKVSRYDITQKQPHLIHKSETRMFDLQPLGDEIFVNTRHAVLRFDFQGKLRQIIPVESKKDLMAMHLTPTKHGYVFNDSLLDIYDLTAKKTFHYKLPIEQPNTIRKLILSNELLAVIDNDGVPRVLSLKN